MTHFKDQYYAMFPNNNTSLACQWTCRNEKNPPFSSFARCTFQKVYAKTESSGSQNSLVPKTLWDCLTATLFCALTNMEGPRRHQFWIEARTEKKTQTFYRTIGFIREVAVQWVSNAVRDKKNCTTNCIKKRWKLDFLILSDFSLWTNSQWVLNKSLYLELFYCTFWATFKAWVKVKRTLLCNTAVYKVIRIRLKCMHG